MKIGILTYHRARNYGAMLQAIALRVTLANMGHAVYFIDYFPKYHRQMYALLDYNAIKNKPLKKKIKYYVRKIAEFPYWFMRYYKFYRFSRKYITPYCKSMNESFDMVVCGSDQIWRKQPLINDYNPIYFGQSTIQTPKYVSYAASLVDLPNNDTDKKKFLQLLSNLDIISVRETQIKDWIESTSNLSCRIDVDPTLLFSGEEWRSMCKIKRIISDRYLLLYDLQCDFSNPTFNYEAIHDLAEQRGLKIVRLRAKASSLGTRNDRHTDGPYEFLSLVRYAEYVFTSSYHGLIFSLLFERQVYCSFPQNSLRALSLLKNLNISSHFLSPHSQLPNPIEDIDYSVITPRMNLLKQVSMQYLSNL